VNLFLSVLLSIITVVTLLPQVSLAQTTTATTTTASTTESIPAPSPAPSPAAPAPNVILESRAQERIINLAANISNRFDAIIARLENITNRLTTRAQKLQSENYDTSAALSSLEQARAALSSAKREMSDIDQAVVYAVGSQDPKTEWQNVKMKYLTARDSIKIAHSELKNTISHLKNAQRTIPAPQATSTPDAL
jgi:hypothetical protein